MEIARKRAFHPALSVACERVFPRFRERLDTALDLIVEFSTLGEYGLGADGVLGCVGARPAAPDHAPQLGGAGEDAARAAVRRTVAGGAAGSPAATPAARRLAGRTRTSSARCGGSRAADGRRSTDRAQSRRARERPPAASQAARRNRAGAPAPGEQLCLAV
jgi:hypothetical protein